MLDIPEGAFLLYQWLCIKYIDERYHKFVAALFNYCKVDFKSLKDPLLFFLFSNLEMTGEKSFFSHISVLSVDDSDVLNKNWRYVCEALGLENEENIARE